MRFDRSIHMFLRDPALETGRLALYIPMKLMDRRLVMIFFRNACFNGLVWINELKETDYVHNKSQMIMSGETSLI